MTYNLLFQGPEIRTGFLKDEKRIQLKEGQEITISTDYTIKGNEEMISMSYKNLAHAWLETKQYDFVLRWNHLHDGPILWQERGLVKCHIS